MRFACAGAARYAYEYECDDACYAAIVQAQIAKGDIRSVDAEAALALPRVLAVLSVENAPVLQPMISSMASAAGMAEVTASAAVDAEDTSATTRSIGPATAARLQITTVIEPPTAPSPIAVHIQPRPVGPVCSVSWAMTGMSTLKFITKVATAATSARMSTIDGVRRR